MENKIVCLLILTHAHGLGRKKAWDLIQLYGSVEKCIEAGWDSSSRLLFKKWKVGLWEEDLEHVQKLNVKLLTYTDENYPKNLLTIADFPLLLYVSGTVLTQDEEAIAMVGTRNATLYGKQAAEKIAAELAASGMSVVSGLARGIDTAAHCGALQGKGRTLAVIGSGLSNLYPRENCALAAAISHSGALISEYPMKTPPAKGLFPSRNRIICGLSRGLCLIESPIDGGGMMTAHLAENAQKTIFALPGRIDWPTFAGNHWLLKKGARLLENAQDVLNYYSVTQCQEQRRAAVLSEEERAFLTNLPEEEKSIEQLVLLTQLPIMQLNVLLTRLVMKKQIKEFPGKIYKKIC